MIKVKEGNCSVCEKFTKLISAKCQYCYWKSRKKVIKPEQRQPIRKKIYKIAKISSKRSIENVLYLKKRRIFMEQNKYCSAKLLGCTYLATDLHHKKGRNGTLLTDERYFLALCRSCHTTIEINPAFAKERGFSLSRLEK